MIYSKVRTMYKTIKQCYCIVWSADIIQKVKPKVAKANNGKTVLLSKFKKSRFIKKTEARRLLSNLGLKQLWSKILFLGNIMF